MQNKPSCIAVVDWNWKGHHPAYFRAFVRVLLQQGCEVLALCPKPDELLSGLPDLDPGDATRFHVQRIRGWLAAPRRTPKKLQPAVSGFRTFLQMSRALDRLSRSTGKKPDRIFFGCIYDWEFYYLKSFEWLLPCKWSGLYLQSFGFRKTTSPIYDWHRRWARPENFLRSKKLSSVATLDEGIVASIETMTGRLNCVVFPDIADESPPRIHPGSLGHKMKRFADGRPIITLAGMLYPQRGVEIFLRTALANPQWCFALVGEIPFHANPKTGTELLRRFLEELPFGYFHPMKVKDGPDYNGVIAVSDVIWNIHLDWPGSSNTLTKAAAFEKPVIVAEGHLLAERVRRFRLGEVCSEDSQEEITLALKRLLDTSASWQQSPSPLWTEYRLEHSESRLRDSFARILTLD